MNKYAEHFQQLLQNDYFVQLCLALTRTEKSTKNSWIVLESEQLEKNRSYNRYSQSIIVPSSLKDILDIKDPEFQEFDALDKNKVSKQEFIDLWNQAIVIEGALSSHSKMVPQSFDTTDLDLPDPSLSAEELCEQTEKLQKNILASFPFEYTSRKLHLTPKEFIHILIYTYGDQVEPTIQSVAEKHCLSENIQPHNQDESLVEANTKKIIKI